MLHHFILSLRIVRSNPKKVETLSCITRKMQHHKCVLQSLCKRNQGNNATDKGHSGLIVAGSTCVGRWRSGGDRSIALDRVAGHNRRCWSWRTRGRRSPTLPCRGWSNRGGCWSDRSPGLEGSWSYWSGSRRPSLKRSWSGWFR
jgi:hypothetical protein